MKRAVARRGPWIWLGMVMALLMVGALVLVNKTAAAPQKAIFIGDSYTYGVGATSGDHRWTTLVARAEGWHEDNRGLGGTGYLATAGLQGCGQPFCESYPNVVRQVARDAPDIVVIAGGQNDFLRYASDRTSVVEAIQQTYQLAHQLMPKTEIVAVGPSTAGPVDDLVRDFDGVVQQASTSVGARYVSLIDPEEVITPDMVLADGAHVGDFGHGAIAQRVIDSLR